MPADTHTLILTKGVHVISSEAAAEIVAALHERRSTVEIELDPFGGVDGERLTLLAVAHVVAVTKNRTPIVPSDKVALIRGERSNVQAKR